MSGIDSLTAAANRSWFFDFFFFEIHSQNVLKSILEKIAYFSSHSLKGFEVNIL